MHWRSVLLAIMVVGVWFLAAPSDAEAKPSGTPAPGGLPINWAPTDPAPGLASRMATNQREHGLNENQLRALSWLGPGPWFNPGTPSGVRGAALVGDTATGKEYLLYEDGRTQLINDPSTWKPF